MEDTILNVLVSIAKGQGSGAHAPSQPGSGLSLPLNFVGGGQAWLELFSAMFSWSKMVSNIIFL